VTTQCEQGEEVLGVENDTEVTPLRGNGINEKDLQRTEVSTVERRTPALIIAFLAALVAITVPALTLAKYLIPVRPLAKHLIVSSDEETARRFQEEMGAILSDPDGVDILCADVHMGVFGTWYKFNCAPETVAAPKIDEDLTRSPAAEAYVPAWHFRTRLLSYQFVYMIESGDPDRLSRSPFSDMMVYKHIRLHNEGNLRGLAAQGLNVTVVFVNVTCEGMNTYMERTGNPIHLGDCKASDAGRIESFQEKFYRRVAISQGRLDLAYSCIDIEAGLSITDQAMRAMIAGASTPLFVRARGEPLSTEEEFSEQLDILKQLLRTSPSAHFSDAWDIVNTRFPRFQVGILGLSGAGKSTTLRWLSYYGGVKKPWRSTFGVAAGGSRSFTRQLHRRGIANDHKQAPFVMFDTMGLERDILSKVLDLKEGAITALVEGRVKQNCEMQWDRGPIGWMSRSSACPGCCTPWKEKPNPQNALDAVLFVTRFYRTDSDDFMQLKDFIGELRAVLQNLRKELVIAVTHMDGCPKEISTNGCIRLYERDLGLGAGNVLALDATKRMPAYTGKPWPGLDGALPQERAATDDVYLEPDSMVELVEKLQSACLKSYENELNLEQDQAARAEAEAPSMFGLYGSTMFGLVCLFLFAWHARQEATAKCQRQESLAAQQAVAAMHQHQVILAAQQAAAAVPGDQQRWITLAENVATERDLQAFFHRRQTEARRGAPELKIDSMLKVMNRTKLTRFVSAGHCDVNPLTALTRRGDTLLFHGCPESAVANIQAEGLSIRFAGNGMLGVGLYGAPDPRKSEAYCRNSQNGKFMFVCRYNLSAARNAGPQTTHRNTVFNEYCVNDERHVVALWLIKLK
jgi:hypothetical protein